MCQEDIHVLIARRRYAMDGPERRRRRLLLLGLALAVAALLAAAAALALWGPVQPW